MGFGEIKKKAKAIIKKEFWILLLVALVMSVVSGQVKLNLNNGLELNRDSDYEIVFENNEFSIQEKEIESITENLFGKKIADMIERVTTPGIYFIIAAVILSSLAVNILHCGLEQGQIEVFEKAYRDEKLHFSDLFSKLKLTFRNFWLQMLILLIVIGGLVLLIVPGIYFAYSYLLAPYILHDHPDMPIKEILRTSRKMMQGEKIEYFLLSLSFVGWSLLVLLASIFGLGTLAYLLLYPYEQLTYYGFYRKIKENYIAGEEASV